MEKWLLRKTDNDAPVEMNDFLFCYRRPYTKLPRTHSRTQQRRVSRANTRRWGRQKDYSTTNRRQSHIYRHCSNPMVRMLIRNTVCSATLSRAHVVLILNGMLVPDFYLYKIKITVRVHFMYSPLTSIRAFECSMLRSVADPPPDSVVVNFHFVFVRSPALFCSFSILKQCFR